MTFRRSSDILFVRSDESAFYIGFSYSLYSFLFGWWGLPWGPLFTILTIINNCNIKNDYTNSIFKEFLQEEKQDKINECLFDNTKCQNCNNNIFPNASFCKTCGTKLNH